MNVCEIIQIFKFFELENSILSITFKNLNKMFLIAEQFQVLLKNHFGIVLT